MQDFTEVYRRCPLFRGLSPADLASMLGCLDGRVVTFARGQAIFPAEAPADRVGIVLEGAVRIVRHDPNGNRAIQARLGPGELFGEVFACAGVARLPVAAEGEQPGRALVVALRRVLETCPNACAFHHALVKNLLRTVAEKTLQLNEKLEITGQRTTREKLLAYLRSQARQADAAQFTIPFDRQGLADYLCVDRSALSAEIGKLRREGVLTSERSRFTLLHDPEEATKCGGC